MARPRNASADRVVLYRTIASASLTILLAVTGLAEGKPDGSGQRGHFKPTTIVKATIVDGTGGPGFVGSVRIEGDRVAAVGEVEPKPGDQIVDGTGLVLAPGFIDTHSHADSDILERPAAFAAVSQGITTVVTGADGSSIHPLSEFFQQLEKAPATVNVASYAGHNTYRGRVLGENFRRPATAKEIEQMQQLLRADLESGALGLSTGLEYDPGIYAEIEEVVALALVAARHGGRYTSHIRSEDRAFWEAVEEILTIGQRAEIPVNISHIKLAMQSSHGQAERLLAQLDEARANGIEVTADMYPYTYWQSTLEVLFPQRDFDSPESARFAITEVSTPEGLLIPTFAPDPTLEGKTLAEIAELRGDDPAITLIDLIREAQQYRRQSGEEEVESVIGVSMDEADIERLLRWPYTNVCTDGELWGAHPRGFGTYPRVLSRYVRERQVLTLEEAIHRMTARAAASAGIVDRGRIVPGLYADLVLFDFATVQDRATTDDPHTASEGIVAVWANGQLVWSDGALSEQRPGRVLRR